MKNAFEHEAELAALREELAALKIDNERLFKEVGDISAEANKSVIQVGFKVNEISRLQQSLADAERRNATLTKAISDAEYRADQGKVWNGMGWTYTGLHSHGQQKVLDILRAALKPTESGASE